MMRFKLYILIMKMLKPLLKILGRMYVAFKHKKIDGDDYLKVSSIIKTGDMLLSHTYGELSNLGNPSEINHGAIYVGNGRIVEAVGSGVREDHLSNFMFKKDVVVVRRPKFSIDDKRFKSCVYHHVGKKYDYEFQPGDGEFYCFEFIAKCYKRFYPDLKLDKIKILDGSFFVSESFTDEFFETIYDSRSK